MVKARGTLRALLIMGTFALLPCKAAADQIWLRNGDRLSGKVVSKSGGVLKFKTAYAGTLEIQWSEIVALATDAPVEVLIKGAKAPLKTRVAPASGGQLRLGQTGTSVPLAGIAYINPKPEESGLGTSYSGHLNASVENSHGNQNTGRLYADANFTARAKKHRYLLGGRINRVNDTGTLTAWNWLATADYDRFLAKDRFVYLRGSLEHDRFKDIERRTTLGAGYGADLLDGTRAKLSIRGGLDQVSVRHMASPDESFPALGWGLHATYKLPVGGATLFHDHDGFWNLDNRKDVTVRSRTGLRVPLMEHLSATAQLNVDWDRTPAPGFKSTDSTLLLGATYSW